LAPLPSRIQATPLAEDGFLYITDSWGVVYKIDGTSGDGGRISATFRGALHLAMVDTLGTEIALVLDERFIHCHPPAHDLLLVKA
jgi:hypothetical protein